MSFYRIHQRVTVDCGTEQMTKQSHKAECDIHNILKQYQRTGIVSHISKQQARYEDLPDPMEFQEAMNIRLQAEEAFGSLPAKIRERYGNDPGQFLAALSDEDEHPFLRKMGVLKPLPKDAGTTAGAPAAPAATPPAGEPDKPSSGVP